MEEREPKSLEERVRWMQFHRHDLGNALQYLKQHLQAAGYVRGETKTHAMQFRQLAQDLMFEYLQRPGIDESDPVKALEDAAEHGRQMMKTARRLEAAARVLESEIPEEQHVHFRRAAMRIIHRLREMQSEVPELKRERLDFSELVRENVVSHDYLDKRGNPVKLELRTEPVEVEGDRQLLGRVFANLLIDATIHPEPEERKTPLRLVVSTAKRGGNAIIRVTTRGARPLSPELMKKIGRVVFSTRAQGGEEHGLGKVQARTVALAHGGELVARNWRGAPTLELRLPLARAA